jgi:hypothetical protein
MVVRFFPKAAIQPARARAWVVVMSGVDEHRVALASDERRRDRRPRLVLNARRQVIEPG